MVSHDGERGRGRKREGGGGESGVGQEKGARDLEKGGRKEERPCARDSVNV